MRMQNISNISKINKQKQLIIIQFILELIIETYMNKNGLRRDQTDPKQQKYLINQYYESVVNKNSQIVKSQRTIKSLQKSNSKLSKQDLNYVSTRTLSINQRLKSRIQKACQFPTIENLRKQLAIVYKELQRVETENIRKQRIIINLRSIQLNQKQAQAEIKELQRIIHYYQGKVQQLESQISNFINKLFLGRLNQSGSVSFIGQDLPMREIEVMVNDLRTENADMHGKLEQNADLVRQLYQQLRKYQNKIYEMNRKVSKPNKQTEKDSFKSIQTNLKHYRTASIGSVQHEIFKQPSLSTLEKKRAIQRTEQKKLVEREQSQQQFQKSQAQNYQLRKALLLKQKQIEEWKDEYQRRYASQNMHKLESSPISSLQAIKSNINQLDKQSYDANQQKPYFSLYKNGKTNYQQKQKSRIQKVKQQLQIQEASPLKQSHYQQYQSFIQNSDNDRKGTINQTNFNQIRQKFQTFSKSKIKRTVSKKESLRDSNSTKNLLFPNNLQSSKYSMTSSLAALSQIKAVQKRELKLTLMQSQISYSKFIEIVTKQKQSTLAGSFSRFNVKINPTILNSIKQIISRIRRDQTISRQDQTEKIKRYFQLQIPAFRTYPTGSAQNKQAFESAKKALNVVRQQFTELRNKNNRILFDQFEQSLRQIGLFDNDIDFVCAKAMEWGMLQWIYLNTIQQIFSLQQS